MLLKAIHCHHWVRAGKEQYNWFNNSFNCIFMLVQLWLNAATHERRPPLTSSTKSETSEVLMWWMTSNREKTLCSWNHFLTFPTLKCVIFIVDGENVNFSWYFLGTADLAFVIFFAYFLKRFLNVRFDDKASWAETQRPTQQMSLASEIKATD